MSGFVQNILIRVVSLINQGSFINLLEFSFKQNFTSTSIFFLSSFLFGWFCFFLLVSNKFLSASSCF